MTARFPLHGPSRKQRRAQALACFLATVGLALLAACLMVVQ